MHMIQRTGKCRNDFMPCDLSYNYKNYAGFLNAMHTFTSSISQQHKAFHIFHGLRVKNPRFYNRQQHVRKKLHCYDT